MEIPAVAARLVINRFKLIYAGLFMATVPVVVVLSTFYSDQ